jgi:hypothetical protein
MKTKMKHLEEAHRLILGSFDKLDTSERRIADGEIEKALCDLYALRITINTAIDLLTGAVGLSTTCTDYKTAADL